MSTSSNGQSGTAPKPELGIRFTWDAQFARNVGIIKLRGTMVQLSAGQYSSSEDHETVMWRDVFTSYDSPYKDFNDFEVTVTLSEPSFAGDARRAYNDAEFRSVHSVNLATSQAMVRVLTKLDKGMAKANEQDGYATTNGQSIVRMARALGCKYLIFDRTLTGPYSGNDDRSVAVNADGIRYIDRIVEHWMTDGNNVYAEQRRVDEENMRARREAARAEREQAAAAAAAAEATTEESVA